MNFYPFHIGDYTLHTGHLSLEEDLAYRRLLDLYYITEKPITPDTDRAARLIRMADHKQAVADVLGEFFLKTDEGYVSKRADAEIAKYQAKAGRAIAANNRRWEGHNLKSDLKSETRSDLKSAPNQDHNQNQSKPKVKNITPPAFDAVASLLSAGVSEQVAKDWIKHRKEKRATVTQTVIDGHISEATKAGISLETALAYACSAGWQGFKADWYESKVGRSQVNGSRNQHEHNANFMNSLLSPLGEVDVTPRQRLIGGA